MTATETAGVDITSEIAARFIDRIEATTGHVDLGRLTDEIVAEMATELPAEWFAWVNAVAKSQVRGTLRSVLQSHRRWALDRTRHEGHRQSVLAAVDADIDPGEARYAIPGNGWSRLDDLQRPDLLLIANQRERLANGNLAEALFLRALAATLPDDLTRVADAVTPLEIIALHEEALQKVTSL
jgi:hypothetical protein